jgi:hypothetical protein
MSGFPELPDGSDVSLAYDEVETAFVVFWPVPGTSWSLEGGAWGVTPGG